MTVDIGSLKKVKNSVIGNPIAKLQLSQDVNFIKSLIDCLNHSDDLCIEAAQILSSLSNASPSSFITLLRLNAPRAFLISISNFTPTTPPTLRTAFTRALRSITISIADIVGPSLWGLKPEHSIRIREEAKEALEYLMQLDSLDVWLPLLEEEGSSAVPMMLANVLRSAEYRRVVAEWVPVEMRQKEVKTRRGWEKMGVGGPFGRQGGWVARGLVALLSGRDVKVQEAALLALAALAKDNPTVASALCKSPNDKDPTPLSTIITLTRSRHTDVQLAACLCATHITRARHPAPSPEDSTIRIILSTLIRFISPQSTDTPPHKTKAAFTLYFLTSDDPKLSELAHSRGCVGFLGKLVKELVVVPPLGNVKNGKEGQAEEQEQEQGEDEEPESTSQLREAVLMALASLSLFSETVRRVVTDELGLLPCLLAILNKGRPSSSSYTKPKHVGTRYAACQLTRALSRSVSVLRTSIVDSGLGMVVFNVFMDGWYVDGEGKFVDGRVQGKEKEEDKEEGEEREDRRVVGAALAAVCNVVNEFSVLKSTYLEQGLLKRLVAVLNSGDLTLKVNALWAIKNLVRKTETETKRDVMREVGWGYLIGLLTDPDEAVQEQAFAILRNLSESEEGIEMVFTEVGPKVLDLIAATLSGGSSSTCDDVVLQAAYTLGNLSNTPSPLSQSLLLTHNNLLTSLRTALAESRTDIKKPLVSAIWELVKPDPRGRRGAFVDAGIVGTLRRLCEWSGVGAATSPGGSGGRNRRGSGASISPTASASIAVPGGGGGGVWGGTGGFGATYFGHPVYYHSHPHHAGVGGHHGHAGGGGGGLDDDKEVVERARVALDWLEHGDV